jgi:hypothetical protein
MTALTFVSHIDDVVIGLPALVTGGIGYLCTTAGRNSSNQTLGSFGFIIGRTLSLVGLVAGLPLLIWNLAKVIFANSLNIIGIGSIPAFTQIAKIVNDHTSKTILIFCLIIGQVELKDDKK